MGRFKGSVCLVVNSFPDRDGRWKGVFNQRAAVGLSAHVDVSVVHLRAWRPGRPLLKFEDSGAFPVWRLAGPFVPPQLPWAEPISVLVYPRFSWRRIRGALEGKTMLHSVGASFAGVLTSYWARKAGCAHVAQVTGTDINVDLASHGWLPWVRTWTRALNGVAFNSQYLLERFRNQFGVVPNMRTVYRGVDIERFHPEGSRNQILSGLSPVRFLFLGGLARRAGDPEGRNRKGGETLLQAWKSAETDQRMRSASLVLAGPETDGSIVQRWRSSLNYPDSVVPIGTLEPTDVAAYLRAADVVLIPSLSEGLPNVAVEACACGTPVVASAVGGVPEVVMDSTNGLLVPPGDAVAWKQALFECQMHPERLAVWGENGRRLAVGKFDGGKYVGHLLDLYEAAQANANEINNRYPVNLRQ